MLFQTDKIDGQGGKIMQKILITDFIGTLIPDDIEMAEYQCGYGDALNAGSRITTIFNDEKYSSKY